MLNKLKQLFSSPPGFNRLLFTLIGVSTGFLGNYRFQEKEEVMSLICYSVSLLSFVIVLYLFFREGKTNTAGE